MGRATSIGSEMLESSGVSTRQIGLSLVFRQTGTLQCRSSFCPSVDLTCAVAVDDRKKRLCATGTRPAHCSESVRRGTPGCATKLDMILSTGRCEFAVCAFQKSSAVAFA